MVGQPRSYKRQSAHSPALDRAPARVVSEGAAFCTPQARMAHSRFRGPASIRPAAGRGPGIAFRGALRLSRGMRARGLVGAFIVSSIAIAAQPDANRVLPGT